MVKCFIHHLLIQRISTHHKILTRIICIKEKRKRKSIYWTSMSDLCLCRWNQFFTLIKAKHIFPVYFTKLWIDHFWLQRLFFPLKINICVTDQKKLFNPCVFEFSERIKLFISKWSKTKSFQSFSNKNWQISQLIGSTHIICILG
jgi:hypothetical protein